MERQIDQMVYELYGLAPGGIAVVESKPNEKEEGQVETILTKEKETPGTWRFKEDKEDHPMTIYLTKCRVD